MQYFQYRMDYTLYICTPLFLYIYIYIIKFKTLTYFIEIYQSCDRWQSSKRPYGVTNIWTDRHSINNRNRFTTGLIIANHILLTNENIVLKQITFFFIGMNFFANLLRPFCALLYPKRGRGNTKVCLNTTQLNNDAIQHTNINLIVFDV